MVVMERERELLTIPINCCPHSPFISKPLNNGSARLVVSNQYRKSLFGRSAPRAIFQALTHPDNDEYDTFDCRAHKTPVIDLYLGSDKKIAFAGEDQRHDRHCLNSLERWAQRTGHALPHPSYG